MSESSGFSYVLELIGLASKSPPASPNRFLHFLNNKQISWNKLALGLFRYLAQSYLHCVYSRIVIYSCQEQGHLCAAACCWTSIVRESFGWSGPDVFMRIISGLNITMKLCEAQILTALVKAKADLDADWSKIMLGFWSAAFGCSLEPCVIFFHRTYSVFQMAFLCTKHFILSVKVCKGCEKYVGEKNAAYSPKIWVWNDQRSSITNSSSVLQICLQTSSQTSSCPGIKHEYTYCTVQIDAAINVCLVCDDLVMLLASYC